MVFYAEPNGLGGLGTASIVSHSKDRDTPAIGFIPVF